MPVVSSSMFEESHDTETATESEMGETRSLVRHMCKSPAHSGLARRVVQAAGAVSVLVAGSAVVALSKSATPSADVKGLVSDAAAAHSREGCDNWNSIVLREIDGLANPAVCEQFCANTSGCDEYGFQPGNCGEGLGRSQGACNLYTAGCSRGTNTCWDHYIMDVGKSATWQVTKNRTGCSNWESITLGAATIELSSNACGLKCEAESLCTGFNFQPGPCAGSEMVGKGACMLFKGTCTEEANPCWDHYTKVAPTTTTLTAQAAQGSDTITVASAAGFNPGDTVTICVTGTNNCQQTTITAARRLESVARRLADTMTLHDVLKFECPATTTTVTKKVYVWGCDGNGGDEASSTTGVPVSTTSSTTTTKTTL
jgi:hypothetical protein